MTGESAGASPTAVGLLSDAGTASLECFGISVRFGGLMAVRDVDLRVPPASIVGLVGPNGAGKSTLFGVMSGLVPASTGVVRLHGRDITGESPQARANLGLGRTFQHPEIFFGLTVREHLVLAHRVRHQKSRVWSDLFTLGSLRGPDPAEGESVDGLVELLGLGALADRPALGLPLGVSRLLELGRALANGPSVLLLDEPSSGMDTSETDEFEETLTRVARERQISVLLVEHDVELVMRLCSTVNVLDFGSLIASGTPDEVRSNPSVRAAYLGEEVSPSGKPSTAHPAPPTEPGKASHIVVAPDRPAAAAPAAVTAVDLEVRYGDALALTGVSFSLAAGKALAVLGANGAGKSSLARAVSGLVPVAAGEILFDGKRIDGWSSDRIRRAGIVHLPEGRGVFRSLSVLDNLKMAAASVKGRSARRDAVDAALDLFPVLGERRRQTAGLLSGGEQQMLSLARALSTAPRLVIADEISLGLAPMLVDLVFEGLDRAKRAGVTVIMIEQYVHRALAFADECLVLQRGTVAWTGSAASAGSELLANYLGAAAAAKP
jgi:branched-chain amino acid transport system ATP-binding protein